MSRRRPNPSTLRPGTLAAFVLLLAAHAARAADVSWVGTSGTWNVGSNWSGGMVPSAGDAVTIAKAGATVTVTDARVVAGLTLGENALLRAGTGGSLTVTGPANVDDGRLYLDGGHLGLATVTAYRRTRCADDNTFLNALPGSSLDLSGLRTITVDATACNLTLYLYAFRGSTVALSNLESITAPSPHALSLSIGGSVSAPSLETIEGKMLLSLLEDVTLDLPALRTLRGDGRDRSVELVASGTPGAQRLSANGLTEASYVKLLGTHDDAFTMDALTTLRESFVSIGPGRLAFPELTSLENTNLVLTQGGTLDLPKLTCFANDRSDVFLSGGGVSAPALQSLLNVHIVTTNATLSLPGVTSYAWTLCEGLGSITVGGGGAIDLSGLRTVTIDTPGCGPLGFNIGANSGGRLDLSGLETIAIPGMQLLSFLAFDPGTVIDLSSLRTVPLGKVVFAEANAGAIIRSSASVRADAPAPVVRAARAAATSLCSGGGGPGGGGFDAVRAQLGELRTLVAADGVDRRAQKKLRRLLAKAEKKLGAAEAGEQAGKAKRRTRGLKGTRAALLRFGSAVQKLQPRRITDPIVGAALAQGAAAAVAAVEVLQAGGG
jgi:hypothetical protein